MPFDQNHNDDDRPEDDRHDPEMASALMSALDRLVEDACDEFGLCQACTQFSFAIGLLGKMCGDSDVDEFISKHVDPGVRRAVSLNKHLPN